jgi:acyl carrier protein
MTIDQQVKTIIAGSLGTSAILQNDMSFADDLYADSLDMVELANTLEDDLFLEIGAADTLSEAETVGDMIKLVEKIGQHNLKP